VNRVNFWTYRSESLIEPGIQCHFKGYENSFLAHKSP